VTELTLLLALEACGIVFALAVVRSLVVGNNDGVSLRRIAAAVERATLAFVTRERRLFALLALGSAATVALAYVGVGDVKQAAFCALGLLFGALLGSAATGISTLISTRAAGATVAMARRRLDDALAVALRGGGASAIVAQSLGTLGALGVFVLAEWLRGTSGGGAALDPAFAALPGYALGAALSAVSASRACGVYHAASDAGGDVAGLDAGLDADDPRNPALIADVVGDQLGGTTARSATLFAAAASSTVAALWLGLGLSGSAFGGASPVMLPLVYRSFGIVACIAALLTARGEEARGAGPALVRGQVSAAAIGLFGFLSASYWLSPAKWLVLTGIGALGAISAAFGSYGLGVFVAARRRALRDVAEPQRGGGGSALSMALGLGLQAAALPLLCAALGAGVACELGAAQGLEGGRPLAFLVWFMGLSALAPLVSGLLSFAAIADSARGMARLSGDGPDGVRRIHRLDELGFPTSTVARVYLGLNAGSAALSLAWAMAGARATVTSLELAPLAVVLLSGALFAAAVVLFIAGSTARAAAQAARDVANEVDRQLRGFAREQGIPMIPAEFTPSYRGCEEVAARAATSNALGAGLAALCPPVVLGIALGLVYRGGGSPLATAALTTFVVTVAVTGLGAALAVDGARAALTGARRASRPEAGSASFGASITGDGLADIWSNAAGPLASSLGLLSSAIALVTIRFLP
jgi:K(+)-stimulated pyrophosphate-energized sodium pump